MKKVILNKCLLFLICSTSFGQIIVYKASTAVSTNFITLDSALSSVGSTTQSTLIIYNNITLASSVTIPNNINLKFYNGGIIELGNYNLTINGSIDAGVYQIFKCNGAGVVNGKPKIERALPQWWKKAEDGIYWDIAIQNAVNFYPKVFFPENNNPEIVSETAYFLKNTILLDLSKDSGYILTGVGFGSYFSNYYDRIGFKDYFFKCINIPNGGYKSGVVFENLNFFCNKGIYINGGNGDAENFTTENGIISRVKITNCSFKNHLNEDSDIAISFSKVFDSEISNNYIDGFKIGIDIKGSDINNINDNRILNFKQYAISDLAFYNFGSQNAIVHNDLLSYIGVTNKNSFIKSTSRHIIIRDNYLENNNLNNKLFAYIDCSKVDITQPNNTFTKQIDITGNRCDVEADYSSKYIYYLTEKFKSLNLSEIPNISAFSGKSTFGKDSSVEDPINYLSLKSDATNNWDRVITMNNCDSFKQWMSFSTSRSFSNSVSGSIIINPSNISYVGYDPGNIASFCPKSIKLKVGTIPLFIKIDQKIIEELNELNVLPKNIKINFITRNSLQIPTNNNDYTIAIVNSPSQNIPIFSGVGTYLTNNTTQNNFVKYSISIGITTLVNFDPIKDWYIVITPKKDTEIRSIEITDITSG